MPKYYKTYFTHFGLSTKERKLTDDRTSGGKIGSEQLQPTKDEWFDVTLRVG